MTFWKIKISYSYIPKCRAWSIAVAFFRWSTVVAAAGRLPYGLPRATDAWYSARTATATTRPVTDTADEVIDGVTVEVTSAWIFIERTTGCEDPIDVPTGPACGDRVHVLSRPNLFIHVDNKRNAICTMSLYCFCYYNIVVILSPHPHHYCSSITPTSPPRHVCVPCTLKCIGGIHPALHTVGARDARLDPQNHTLLTHIRNVKPISYVDVLETFFEVCTFLRKNCFIFFMEISI